MINFKVQFQVKKQKYTICKITASVGTNFVVFRGTASRNLMDEWNPTVGKKLAFNRAWKKMPSELRVKFADFILR